MAAVLSVQNQIVVELRWVGGLNVELNPIPLLSIIHLLLDQVWILIVHLLAVGPVVVVLGEEGAAEVAATKVDIVVARLVAVQIVTNAKTSFLCLVVGVVGLVGSVSDDCVEIR